MQTLHFSIEVITFPFILYKYSVKESRKLCTDCTLCIVYKFKWLTKLIKTYKGAVHEVDVTIDGPHAQIKFLK